MAQDRTIATSSLSLHLAESDPPAYAVDISEGWPFVAVMTSTATFRLFAQDPAQLRDVLNGMLATIDVYEQNQADIEAAWTDDGMAG